LSRDYARTVVLNVTLFMRTMPARKFRPVGIGLIENADAYTDSYVEWRKKFRNFDRRSLMQRRARYVYRRSDSAPRMFIVA